VNSRSESDQSGSIAMEGLKRGVAALDDLDTVAQLKKAL
jgi:hypothetical protein